MSFLAYQQSLLLTDWPYGSAIAFILLALSGGAVLLYLRAIERGRFAVVFR
jgi:hypothetical protein